MKSNHGLHGIQTSEGAIRELDEESVWIACHR